MKNYLVFNDCIRSDTFRKILEKAVVRLVFKKGDPTSKTNYRPVITQSNVPKIFEKLIYFQSDIHMQNIFSIYSTGVRKNRGTQHALA